MFINEIFVVIMSEELAEILGDEVNVIIDLPERELVELDEIPGEGVLVRKKEVIKFNLEWKH